MCKGGARVKRKVDERANAAREQEIKEILRKNKCVDIFRDAFLNFDAEDGQVNQQNRDRLQKFTKTKFERKRRSQLLSKLDLLLALRLAGGRILLRFQLEKIRLIKELLVIDLQSQNEVFIRKELNCKHLPLSF